MILADWVGRREAGFNALGELAELLGGARAGSIWPFQFSRAASAQSDRQSDKVIPQADLILALDVPDLEGATVRRVQERGNRRATPLLPAGAKVINVALDDLLVRAWATDFNKLREADLMITADTSVFLPELVRRLKAEKKLGESKDEIAQAPRRMGENLPREESRAGKGTHHEVGREADLDDTHLCRD